MPPRGACSAASCLAHPCSAGQGQASSWRGWHTAGCYGLSSRSQGREPSFGHGPGPLQLCFGLLSGLLGPTVDLSPRRSVQVRVWDVSRPSLILALFP